MLIPYSDLAKKYNVRLRGVLHVGAHECEELPLYESHINRDSVLWIEALKGKVDLVKDKYPGILIENEIVSDVQEEVTFNISNNFQSSSILELGKHKEMHPDVYYVCSITKTAKKLDDIMDKHNIDFNFVNLDIQGAELKALKGMTKYLQKVDYIYTEVNGSYVYQNCALVTELDDFLEKYRFKRLETKWYEDNSSGWGDAFYIKLP